MFIGGFIGIFILMELIAWSLHKYVMHGFLWHLHEDHHQPTGKKFQKNDWFLLIFAIPSWLSIMLGFIYWNMLSVGIGFGILAYGIVYFWVHEVLIHRRLKLLNNSKNRYFKGLIRAHKMHHKHRFKEDGECFGMLVVPFKYFKK